MSRDYLKEKKWLNANYKRLEARVKKEKAEKFLKKINKPFSTWVNEKVDEELTKK